MGYIKHHAIILTTWQDEAAMNLAKYAKEIEAEALVGEERINGYITVCITPDGSKEGWEGSYLGDYCRLRIKEWLKDHSEYYFEWVEVSYGDDPSCAEIVDSAWTNHSNYYSECCEVSYSDDREREVQD